jgi:hypothetical protein
LLNESQARTFHNSIASPLRVQVNATPPNVAKEELKYPAATTAPVVTTATPVSSSAFEPPPRTAHSVVPSSLTFHTTASPLPAVVSVRPPNVARRLKEYPAATTAFVASTATPFR